MNVPQKTKVVTNLVINENYEVCVIERNAKYFSLKWSLPGGRQNPDETDEQTAIRETKEEVCLDVEIIERLGERTSRDTYFVDLVYYFSRTTKPGQKPVVGPAANEQSEIHQAIYVQPREAKELFTTSIFGPLEKKLDELDKLYEEKLKKTS